MIRFNERPGKTAFSAFAHVFGRPCPACFPQTGVEGTPVRFFRRKTVLPAGLTVPKAV